MTILEMFKKCLRIDENYNHTEANKGSYFIEYDKDTLYVYFQCSNGGIDWWNNFDFAAKPYKDMPIDWKAHRGFVRVWKEIEPFIRDDIMNPEVKKINIIGYSHGAAITVLAHEYAWFNREDIRNNIFSYSFEPPRIFCGNMPRELAPRWENLTVFRNGADLITYLPPKLFGYRHIGKLVHLNKERKILVDNTFKLRCIDEHNDSNVIASLKAEGFDK